MAIPKNVNKFSLVFALVDVFVDDKNVAKMLKRTEFNKKVQAVVVDKAHLVQQWKFVILVFNVVTSVPCHNCIRNLVISKYTV